MTLDVTTRNLVALVLQMSVVGGIGALLPVVMRVRAPRPLLYYWHALLGLILLLPSLPAAGTRTTSLPVLRFTASAAPRGSHGLPVGRYLVILICSVALVRLGWIAAGYVALCRYRRRSELLSGQIRISSEIAGPVSFGIWRPVILLPESWRRMSPELQKAVICHESAHIRRHDWAVHLVEELILSALWFQPVVWYIVSQIRMAREQVVDLEVVTRLRAPETYIEALLTAAQGDKAMLAPCFARKHQLVERIRRITKEYRMSKRRIALSFAGIALALVVGGRVAVWSFPLQAAQADKVYKVGNGVTAPKLLYKVDPDYTAEAKDAHIEGTVLLAMEISAEGVAQNIQVQQGVGSGLNEKAVEAIQKWRFAPGTKDGEPVTVAVKIEVNFHLK